MENTGDKVKSSDEVDITHFFRWVGNGFRRVGDSIFYSLAVIRNAFFSHLLFFSLIILTGLILGGLYFYLLQKKYYQSSMVLSCDYLNTQVLENTIQKLNSLASEAKGKGLASELHIDEESASKVQGFEFKAFVSEDDVVEMEVLREQLNSVATKKELVDKVLGKLMIDNKNAYQITVKINDPAVLKSLEKGIVDYFKNKAYISNRIESQHRSFTERKNKLIRESKKLDSLKEVVFLNLQHLSKSNRGSNNIILNDETLGDPLELFREDLRINSELLTVQRQLDLREDFEVIDGFTASHSLKSASLFKVLLISAVAAFLAGYLILGGIYLDRALARYPLEE